MVELFRAGGPVMFPLLGCSILAVAVILERSWRFGRLSLDDVCARVTRAAYGVRGRVAVERMRIAALREARVFGRGLGILSTLVSLAPLLGIFGTVLGIMESFQFLDGAAVPAPEAAKQGLARALLTTAFGLAIAMVSLIGLKVFQGRLAVLQEELEIRCGEAEVAAEAAREGEDHP